MELCAIVIFITLWVPTYLFFLYKAFQLLWYTYGGQYKLDRKKMFKSLREENPNIRLQVVDWRGFAPMMVVLPAMMIFMVTIMATEYLCGCGLKTGNQEMIGPCLPSCF